MTRYTVCKVKHEHGDKWLELKPDDTKCLKFLFNDNDDQDHGVKVYTYGRMNKDKTYRLRCCSPGKSAREVFFKNEQQLNENEIKGKLEHSRSLRDDHLDLRMCITEWEQIGDGGDGEAYIYHQAMSNVKYYLHVDNDGDCTLKKEDSIKFVIKGSEEWDSSESDW